MMAREHVCNLALIPGSVVTAIADPDAGSRDRCADEVVRCLGSEPRLFEDHKALLASGHVDALLIASPNDTHKAILDAILLRT